MKQGDGAAGMQVAFWVAAFVVAYVYAGYPALLAARARLRPQPVRRPPGWRLAQPVGDRTAPGVSIIVAARNEAARLPARIQNLLALRYPADLLEIIVVSDGSTDETRKALAPWRDRVRLIALTPVGKAAALNAGAAAARHEILAFADARQRFAPEAIVELVANFADPAVGGVSGELVLDCESLAADRGGACPVADGVGAYWRYEKWLRRRESLIGSTLGATGAIYALRRSLWRPLPPDTLIDDVLAPMRAVLGGSRVVFEERARAFDRAPRDASDEWRRKVRTLAGNYQILWLEPRLLLPWANPVWWQFVSHKVGRLVAPYALAVLFVSSLALARTGPIYGLAFGAQAVFYLLAAYGGWLEARRRRLNALTDGAPPSASRVVRSA